MKILGTVRHWLFLGSGFAASLTIAQGVSAEEMPVYSSEATAQPEVATHGMVTSRTTLATQAGLDILKDGGNAVDAAVTVGFALAVTCPQAGNLGGGGFMLIHDAKAGETVAIDYREKAPLAATRDMFLDEEGKVDKELSRYSHLSAGVPGTVAGLALALDKYGTISLKEALAPAIELAEDGFPVNQDLYASLVLGKERLSGSPEAMEMFYHEDGTPYQVGETLRMPELAKTLRMIAKDGPAAFYQGPIGEALVADMEEHNGIITHEDLEKYRPSIREPVEGNYRGYDIISMPPPSSGGIHIIQIMNILEGFDLHAMGSGSARTVNTMAEAMKYAYADRSKHLGDSDFEPVPVDWLLSKDYAAEIRAKIDPDKSTPSSEILPGEAPHEGIDTTNFGVMDEYGNAVVNTYTINFSFGSKILVPGMGFFLNNEMDDFSAKPGVPNAFGLIGGEFNAIESEKRMLSSMSPTLVMKDGRPFLISGSRGGSLIITATLQVLLNVIDHDMNVAEAVSAPRMHHQWLPDILMLERGFSPDTIEILEGMGHEVKVGRAMGTTNSIMFKDGIFYGAGDPRNPDTAALGY
ncbi:MAG: gamma-glutamyltransferase 1 [Puniceicoccaceae bacterium 5H]|nr:MAG: gamma-glutamyltransferase 1 [Puniceicoccaceae bacterium 5H]